MLKKSVVPARRYLPVPLALRVRGEHGQATAEYGVVALIAVALAMAVFALVSGNAFDGVLKGLIETVLKSATALVKGS